MGKRDEKKQKIYSAIVEAAKNIFSRQDFDITTMDQIAKEAGVGLGTAYNYFKSKEELYILSMAENIDNAPFFINTQQIKKDDISETIADVIINEIKKMNYIKKKIWKTALPFMMNGLKSDSSFVHNIFKADFKLIDKIKKIFEDLKQENKLPLDFPVEMVVDIIFGHIIYVIMSYIYLDQFSFEEACEKIRSGIKYILK